MTKNIVVIGDTILDQYHFGQVKRLNPESPNPLLNIERSENRLWGAANVAANVVWLWASCTLLGNISQDSHGEAIVRLCGEYGLEFFPIITEQPTITKARFVETSYGQQLLRADFEEMIALTTEDMHTIIATIQRIDPDIIICSDYMKGVLHESLLSLLCENFADKKILVDTKPSKFALYKNIYLFKPNFKEFKEIVGQDVENDDAVIAHYGKSLAEQYRSNFVITRWAKGATIISTKGEITHLHTEAQQVFDVSGAGDTFLAGMAVKLAEWATLSDAVLFGNKASAVAVSKIGTSVVKRQEV